MDCLQRAWPARLAGALEAPHRWDGTPIQVADAYTLSPAVSPDGRLIAAFYGHPQTERQAVQPQIAIFPVDGGPPVKLLPVPETANQQSGLRWTRDGQSIAYVDHQNGFANLWAISLDGTIRKLTDLHADQIFDFDWSWDGLRPAVVVGAEPHDMVLMENG